MADSVSGMKVAAVLDCHTVAINRGSEAGVTAGDLLCITSDVIDPETGDVIGQYPNLRLKVTEVYPRFCVAETYRLVGRGSNERYVVVNVGDDVAARSVPRG